MFTVFRTSHHRYCSDVISVSLAVLLLVSGCSTTATGDWEGPRADNAPYDDILIIAVSPDPDMRHALENVLTDVISAGGTKASASMHLESDMEHPPRTSENVAAMAKKINADAVLAIHWVGETVKAGRTKAEAYVDLGPQVTVIETSGYTEVWASDYTIHQVEGQLVADSDTKMEATLYDVADQGRGVYKIAVETKIEEDGDSNYVIADNVATAITKNLRQHGLIR
jgi:hypothetical protein